MRRKEKINLSPLVIYLSKQVLKSILALFAFLMVCSYAKAQSDPLYYSDGEDLLKKTARYLFLKVKTNKKEALIGECISAWYYLYVAVDIQGKLTKSPSFTGFASYDVEGGNTEVYDVEKINGISFRVYRVKQVQLFGLRPGVQRLEPVELEASVRYRKMPNDINDILTSSGQSDTLINYNLKSNPFEININKLPKTTSDSFTGAVGDFNFSALASSNTIEAGKADTIQWEIEGSGNWHDIMFPAIKWPDDTEVYEPFSTESLDNYTVPVQGFRTIAYPVVFNKKGNYLIAPVSFTFFNPALGQYKTIKTESIRITVTDAPDTEAAIAPEKQSPLTALFSRYAIIIFPIAAAVLLGLLFFRRQKG